MRGTLWNGIVFLIVIVLISCPPYIFAGTECPQPEGFIALAPNSKYFYKESQVSVEEATSSCTAAKLEPFLPKHSPELQILQKRLAAHSQRNKFRWQSWAVGMKRQGGIYVKSNSSRPITYQAWLGVPRGIGDCMILQMLHLTPALAMKVSDCSAKVLPLCQHKVDSDCYKQSPEGEEEQCGCAYSNPHHILKFVVEAALIQFDMFVMRPLGFIANRELHISGVQETQEGATAACARAGFQLLDLNMDVTFGGILGNLLEHHLLKYGIHRETSFWTSGRQSKKDSDDFTWQSTGDKFQKNTSLSWGWDPTEDFHDPCLTFGLTNDGHKYQSNDILQLRFTNCKHPFYYICYYEPAPEVPPMEEDVLTSTPPLLAPPSPAYAPLDEVPSNVTWEEEPREIPCEYADIPKLNLTLPGIAQTDIINLLKLVVKYDLSTGKFIPKESKPRWRYDIVNNLTMLTKTLCPDFVVPQSYLNIVWNLIHIYMHHLPIPKEVLVDEKYWRNLTTALDECWEAVRFSEIAMSALEGMATDEDGGPYPIRGEAIDGEEFPNLDLVLDSFWHMYQLSVGACYNFQSRNIEWLSEYFVRFRDDVIVAFRQRWFYASLHEQIPLGVLFADIDISKAAFNLRACAQETFVHSGIMDRMPVRPLPISMDGMIGNWLTDEEYIPRNYYAYQ